jgi:hypothetical protein
LDVEAALTFGNHKGASSKPKLLQELVKDGIIHSFALPLPLSKIKKIKEPSQPLSTYNSKTPLTKLDASSQKTK